MIVFDAARTRAALGFETLIPALRRAFAEGADVPLRHTHTVGANGGQGTVLIMPAWNAAGYLGIKTVNIYPDNARRGLPGLHSTYALYDAATGVPLAYVDGDEVTSRRTAAASALAADYLARADAQELLIVGSGRVAAMLAPAYGAVRALRRVRVWSRRAASAARLADSLAAQGWEAQPVTDLEAAVRRAHIVSCATLSEAPLVQGDWLAPGTHLDLIGSFKPSMIEADPGCFAGSAVYVDTDEALAKAGDLLAAQAAGTLCAQDVRGRLDALCRGTARGREDADTVTVFKSVGSALEDLAAAQLVYETGLAQAT
ncbi:ornithine cyclodeaminase family protein [Verticiella sediminum]|uniref:Ornithine cyclodeaminase family protein n=1 Tax=Verticiella sediminum TaxID=1247510 RepID=A0A556AMQ3_9BURK|nr:ornithine cyclodeaminase family protein [Verticiella sediminum]TSH94174.1 ornithine cyclodeaminase family protein [Verticiella sediminum]